MDKKQKRTVVLGVSSLLLVALVIAVTVGLIGNDTNSENGQGISTSNKAITTICQSVDYEDACIKSLSSKGDKIDDPKELVKIGFEEAMKSIEEAVEKSVLLQKVHQDPRTNEALTSCTEQANMAMNDLNRSFNKFVDLDLTELDRILSDLKIWLSGAMTYEETCLDGFENTTGDAGEKMREVLKSAMQLTTNALAMVTEIAFAFTSMGSTPTVTNRHLLAADGFPDWIDTIRRSLVEAKPENIRADLVVAQDGSGKYKTINEALKDIPKKSNKTFVLYIKEGVYEEKVQFNSSLTHLMVIGDGPNKTRISGKLNRVDGISTFHTATVAVLGDYFIGKGIGFENTAGSEKEQAVALRVGADKSIFYNCQMDGYQDTLYVHTHRQFYRNCVISGTIDFIFGDSSAVFQNCTLLVRRPLEKQQCIVTAQGRKNVREPTGIVLQNCTITADTSLYPVKATVKSYLARPWKEYSRTIIMESYIDDLIQPQGYLPWNDTFALDTLFYTEFNNRGPRSAKDQRVKWPGIKELTVERIQRFTATQFIDGNAWIPPTKVPYAPGLILPPPLQNPVAASPISPSENIDVDREGKQQLYDEITSYMVAPSRAHVIGAALDPEIPAKNAPSLAPEAAASFQAPLGAALDPEIPAKNAPSLAPEAAASFQAPLGAALVPKITRNTPSLAPEAATPSQAPLGSALGPKMARNAPSLAPEAATPSQAPLGAALAPEMARNAPSLSPEAATPFQDHFAAALAPKMARNDPNVAAEATTPFQDPLGAVLVPKMAKNVPSLAPEVASPFQAPLDVALMPKMAKNAPSFAPEATVASQAPLGVAFSPDMDRNAPSLTPKVAAPFQAPLDKALAPEMSRKAPSPDSGADLHPAPEPESSFSFNMFSRGI